MELPCVLAFELHPSSSVGPRWERWLRHFQNYLQAKGVEGKSQQKALLLHCAGVDVFDLSDALGVTADTTYAETVSKLTAYFSPKRSREYETYIFRQARQQSDETLNAFHARL